MRLKTDKIVVIDLEATCWEGDGEYQRTHSEIIEIGVCNLVIKTGEITNKKSIYVKPIRSEISEFCTKLTGITDEIIEAQGMTFTDAIQMLKKEYNTREYMCASYGAYDYRKIAEQCKEYNIKNPLGKSHMNVKDYFSLKMKLDRAVGMDRALKLMKEPLEGKHHSGADDAYNIAKIVKYILN